jgi:glutamate-1-semialdehyde 2,1-aminomutase
MPGCAGRMPAGIIRAPEWATRRPANNPTPGDPPMQRERSLAAFARARQLMPGGVNSPARAFGGVGGQPVFFDRGQGAWLFDLDGNRYIDYVGSWGPMILGHAHPRVVEAVRAAAGRGTSFGAPTLAENRLAEMLIEAVPSIHKVRLVSSGTEATMSAVRLARGFTGRAKVVKFAGNYHGHVDSLLVAAGSAAATLGVPDSPGVTEGTARDTLVLGYNDVPGLEAAFAEHGPEIAAAIVEPVAGNMGCVPASGEFLAALRRLTRQHGAVLIFDEVISGFRVAYGGAQSILGIEPDLTTLGKIIGGGLPMGAYGGRAEIMDHVLPAGRVFQAGTLSGNPLATAAGIATLMVLRESDAYQRLDELATRLAEGLGEAAAAAGMPHRVNRFGSLLSLFFSAEPVTDWATAARCDTRQYARYFWGMLDRAIYLPCSQYEALFLSTAHTDEDIDATVAAAGEVIKELP